MTFLGCSTPGGSSSGGVSGGAKQNTSVLQIGLAPRPVPSGSRMTPPMPVLAPPYGSMAEGRVCVSTFKQTWGGAAERDTPAVVSEKPAAPAPRPPPPGHPPPAPQKLSP